MQSYKDYFTNKNYLISFFSGLLLLGTSLVLQFFASNYATRVASDSVTDIILSNTRVYDVDMIFVWGAVILLIVGLVVALTHVNYIPFMMKSIALLTLTRAIFISLTHISPFPTHMLISSAFFRDAFFNGIFNGNDLFFSGHTAVPFLLALIFWNQKSLRYIFLGFSIVLGTAVLLGHLHYSIDVLAAFFITYAVFDLCKFFFKKDWELFLKK